MTKYLDFSIDYPKPEVFIMKSRSKKQTSPFLIGIFVLAGTLILIGGIIWLGTQQFLKETSLYVTYFEGSVQGLEKGSPVKYLGVPVGNIEKINVAPDGKLVEVLMQIDSKIKIDDELRVKAEMSGLAGGKFLQLHYPSDTLISRMHPLLSFKPVYPVIYSSPSGIEEIEIAARDVLNKLLQFRYKEVSDEMVSFLNASSNFFNNQKLYNIISELEKSSRTLSDILAKTDSSAILSNLINTTESLKKTSTNLENLSDSIQSQFLRVDLPGKVTNIVSQYDSVMIQTSQILNILGLRTETVLFSMGETMQGVNLTNKQLQRTLRKITQNPGQLLFAEPPPAEK